MCVQLQRAKERYRDLEEDSKQRVQIVTQELAAAQGANEDLKAQLQAFNANLEAANERVREHMAHWRAAQQEAQNTSQQVGGLAPTPPCMTPADATCCRIQLATKEEELTNALERTQGELRRVSADAERAQQQLGDLTAARDTAQHEAASLKDQVAQLEAERLTQDEQLRSAQQKASQQGSSIMASVTQLNTQLSSLQQRVTRLQVRSRAAIRSASASGRSLSLLWDPPLPFQAENRRLNDQKRELERQLDDVAAEA